MAGAVELSADLADLADDELVMEHQTVAAERPAGGRARDLEHPAARAEERDVPRIQLVEGGGLALFHQLNRFEHDLGRGAVDSACLVVGPPLGGPPVLLERLVVELLRDGAERHNGTQPARLPRPAPRHSKIPP